MTLEELAVKLEKFKGLVNSLMIYSELLPKNLIGTDLYSLQREILRLEGFVDCMIMHEIPLLPDTD